MAGLFNIVQYIVPWRYMVAFQVPLVGVMVGSAWRRVTGLLVSHPEVSRGTMRLCSTVHGFAATITSIATGLDPSASAELLPCSPGSAASR